MQIERSITPKVIEDLKSKMVFIAGPRQVGKTTLTRSLPEAPAIYLNYDATKDRKIILQESWERTAGLLILDEIHKMKKWKPWLKGVWDTRPPHQQIVVTGSARLDFVRRGGESLAGRYFLHRLHPFSIRELHGHFKPEPALKRLLERGGFPEPLFADDASLADRWRLGYTDRIIREDLIDLQRITQLKSLELLIELLTERVGSPISYSSLAEDLSVAPKTIKHWLEVLESLYLLFLVRPYSKSLNRAIRKEPKVYFFDLGKVPDPGARLENLVALHLLKRAHFLEDEYGKPSGLFYIRDKEKREVDFLTTLNKEPEFLIEVKSSEDTPTGSLIYYASKFKKIRALRLVRDLYRNQEKSGVSVRKMADWLADLET